VPMRGWGTLRSGLRGAAGWGCARGKRRLLKSISEVKSAGRDDSFIGWPT
jgi:hypothetical protein